VSVAQPSDDRGHLAENVMHFARVLRAAGLPIGPGKVLDAVSALVEVGISNRDDFYWTLHAVFVNRARDRELFDQAFHVFWRNPRFLERMMMLSMPQLESDQEQREELSRRLSDALRPEQAGREQESSAPDEVEIEATFTWSESEMLQKKDFEQMSAEELERARASIRAMRLPLQEVATRRFRAHPSGHRVDMHASLRASLRSGSGMVPLVRSRRRTRPPPLVILCDISGSMTQYSRMLLHFAHTLTTDRDRVHSFVFGTRLTNITRSLRERDVDEALKRVSEQVVDWSGGTRIGASLHEFNRDWSRRVLGQGAVVLLITDGLDRDAGEGLEHEIQRLHMSARRLIWLNPLLRYDAFEPRALGMRALLPHVDEFRAAHNLASLEELTEVLGRHVGPGHDAMSPWLKTVH
jgi:uncharacterized protein with von Willebrand factor type A (vWA) domain